MKDGKIVAVTRAMEGDAVDGTAAMTRTTYLYSFYSMPPIVQLARLLQRPPLSTMNEVLLCE